MTEWRMFTPLVSQHSFAKQCRHYCQDLVSRTCEPDANSVPSDSHAACLVTRRPRTRRSCRRARCPLRHFWVCWGWWTRCSRSSKEHPRCSLQLVWCIAWSYSLFSNFRASKANVNRAGTDLVTRGAGHIPGETCFLANPVHNGGRRYFSATSQREWSVTALATPL